MTTATWDSVSDQGWAAERGRGNTGRNLTIAVSDPTYGQPSPGGWHAEEMMRVARQMCPDAAVVAVSADATGIRRGYRLGACVIALPWGQVGMTADLDRAIREAANYGVLLFAAAGDGTPTTLDPATHPLVYSCAAGFMDGRLDPRGTPVVGKVDVGMVEPVLRASGASVRAACVYAQWCGYGTHLYRTAGRREAFDVWLRVQGLPSADGRCLFPVWR